jgi:hypothetical protein
LTDFYSLKAYWARLARKPEARLRLRLLPPKSLEPCAALKSSLRFAITVEFIVLLEMRVRFLGAPGHEGVGRTPWFTGVHGGLFSCKPEAAGLLRLPVVLLKSSAASKFNVRFVIEVKLRLAQEAELDFLGASGHEGLARTPWTGVHRKMFFGDAVCCCVDVAGGVKGSTTTAAPRASSTPPRHTFSELGISVLTGCSLN